MHSNPVREIIDKDAFDVHLLRPGDPLQWQNSYSQWQNAEFICITSDVYMKVKEMKNDRVSTCSHERVRPRFSADGIAYVQQF